MAKTITWVRSTTLPDVQLVGTRKRVTRLLTLTTDATTGTNTYASGGVPFAEATNAALAAAFDLGVVERLKLREPLTQAAVAGDSHLGKIDLANLKLILLGGDANSATVAALKEIPNTTALGDSKVWTAEVEAEGY